jgi:hypothetical protein
MSVPPLWRRIFDERRGVLLPLIVALVANVAALVVAVLPLRAAVSTAEAESIEAMQQLGEARRLERQVTQARTSRETANVELRRFYADVLPRDFATVQKTMNLWVAEAAQATGLVFGGSRFDWDEIRDSKLSRASSRITLRGSYPNIRRFLHAVETAEEFVVVEQVELAQQDDQPTAGGPLEVSLDVATYFLTKPE